MRFMDRNMVLERRLRASGFGLWPLGFGLLGSGDVLCAERVHARNQGARGSAVLRIFLTECLMHELFFHSAFYPEGQPEQSNCQQASRLAAFEHSADKGK